VIFPTLFEKSLDTYLKIAQAYTEEGWWIPFWRNLGQEDLHEAWQELCNLVDEINLEDTHDKISWRLEPSGRSSVKSLYLDICKSPQELPHPFNKDKDLYLAMITFSLEEANLMESVLCVVSPRALIISSSNVF
jgi:hypothetical protein